MMTIEANRCSVKCAPAEQTNCPFEDRTCNVCSASFSGFYVGTERRMMYCSTENYDSCPFFLSRVIRKKY